MTTDEQRQYYADTAADYEAAHMAAGDEHYVAAEYMVGLFSTLRVESILDVGCGTGRACRFFRERYPGARVLGVEPVFDLLAVARSASGLAYVQASGLQLPFADNSFDAVCVTGVLHHVAEPLLLVAELMRVARKGVFISDANRFGQGSRGIRIAKLLLHRIGVWELLVRLRTRGTGTFYSNGDGLFYSYSVYDSLPQLEAWADRVVLIATQEMKTARWGPLLQSPSVLLAALRETSPDWASPATSEQD